jgi:hypothetical protein
MSLAVTVPPLPFIRQIVYRTALSVLLGTLTGAFGATTILVYFTERWQDLPVVLTVLAALAVLVLATFRAIVRLIHAARYGRQPTVIRASAGQLEIDGPGLSYWVSYRWPADSIADLEVRPAGARPLLFLQITFKDDTFQKIAIPWRSRQPMIELEDNLRDVLRLPAIRP